MKMKPARRVVLFVLLSASCVQVSGSDQIACENWNGTRVGLDEDFQKGLTGSQMYEEVLGLYQGHTEAIEDGILVPSTIEIALRSTVNMAVFTKGIFDFEIGECIEVLEIGANLYSPTDPQYATAPFADDLRVQLFDSSQPMKAFATVYSFPGLTENLDEKYGSSFSLFLEIQEGSIEGELKRKDHSLVDPEAEVFARLLYGRL